MSYPYYGDGMLCEKRRKARQKKRNNKKEKNVNSLNAEGYSVDLYID